MSQRSLFAANAYLPQGWTCNVRLHWNADGALTEIELSAQRQANEAQAEFVLPGMTNLHSHAFQRAMAGMTEMAGESKDSFWTWRDLMYRYALHITPEQIQAIAAQLYMECLRQGYTSVCEFHYLHRAIDGNWYARPEEMALRVISAAKQTGIGVTMLPVLYSYADFNAQPLRHDQRRFTTSVDDVLTLVDNLAPERNAQQTKEVDACIAATGKRPVELLLDTGLVDQRWCLVHATHLTKTEVQGIAASGAVAGICTTTEGNLGDGFFDLPDYIAAGGRFGIGSDSHVSQSPVEELRWLEYGQRLRLQGRNIANTADQRQVGDFLWQQALLGGAQASGRQVGQLARGYRADMLILDDHRPNLAGLTSNAVLNTWLFAGNDNLVRDVYVAGKRIVQDGRHVAQTEIQQAYVDCMRNLRAL